MIMCGVINHGYMIKKIHITLFLIFGLLPFAQCAEEDSGTVSPLASSILSDQIGNFRAIFRNDIKDNLGFCVKDVDSDWDGAFNFSKDLAFIANCVKQINGDVTQRLCTAAELRVYFRSFQSSTDHIIKPNKNCNLQSWVAGCEPGWASAANDKVKINLKNMTYIPPRTTDSQPCCEGFFCPQGITCMIPIKPKILASEAEENKAIRHKLRKVSHVIKIACPLGSYCPQAKLNTTTGVCDPFGYQLPPGKTNHTCGGADVWADVVSSDEIFCSAGSYCPTNTKKETCSSGHYCRMGSTVETSCFKLSTCNPETATQDIHVYGIILIGILTIALLIIYNCSDKVISVRYKRLAKSREAAARSARETAQARQRWRTAKDVAKKGGGGLHGLQQQLSRTFSRKTTAKKTELKIPGHAKPTDKENFSLPPSVPTNPSSSKDSSSAPKSKKKEPSNLTKMMNSFDNNPDSNEGFHLEIGDKNIKKQQPKAKTLHSHSQIFKYAYGQLEKEKAQQQKNKNLTFSGVISMATDDDVRTRPPIEISFQNLTLTLKGRKKHLLRCVSGKIAPGRVTAVMGPSGAGKTTFLSALGGKVSGCLMSGVILINGKSESIHSYKRIIGYVPQDDVVHGNLTVEENLRFSARCRLAADLPKAEKVLVVERVIESLGLQNVRDSLVGTVEQRGISGGQKKRVNVGLEMVMEPSLLILDEPTSGLDSSSSNLLLRALRREALEGVNISMVVHQPSYALFKMFDDLILLAKGGLTVYHGSVKKVEEYFGGLGINVPDRVNPPDHYIDILEGIVPSSSVSIQQLPVRWMLHNGYPVPPDMMHLCDQIATPSRDNKNSSTEEEKEQSFAGDLWQDMVLNVELQRDHIEHRFLKNRDLSNRATPGSFQQYRYFLGRVTKQRLREFKLQVADYLILLLAGAALGTLAKIQDETFGALGYTYTVIAISLLCKIAALRSFALDKIHYWRESASGMSSFAYFMSKDTIDHFNTFIKPLVYLSMFYFFNNPRSSFGDNYVVLLCLVYCVTGMAYVFAILLEPGQAQLWCVLLPVVLTLIANQDKDSLISKTIGRFCYPKWALEAFVIANAERYSGVWLITRCASLMQSGYDLSNWTSCLLCLVLSGIMGRLIAFFCLLTFQKK